jgi:hypothetical protein
MENIDIEFIEKIGWIRYPRHTDAPENCFYKNTYPIALWWDDSHEGFWVVNLKELNTNPIIIGKEFIKSEADYDRLIIPILKVLEYEQRAQ